MFVWVSSGFRTAASKLQTSKSVGSLNKDTPSPVSIAEINISLETCLQWFTPDNQPLKHNQNTPKTSAAACRQLLGKCSVNSGFFIDVKSSKSFLWLSNTGLTIFWAQLHIWNMHLLSIKRSNPKNSRRQSYILKFPHPQRDLFLDSLQSAIQKIKSLR